MSMDRRLELVPIPVSDVGPARGPQARPRTNRDGRRRPRVSAAHPGADTMKGE